MSSIKATYSSPNSSKILEIPLDSTTMEHLTDSTLKLKDQINELLTQVLEEEKTTSSTPIPEVTEEQDPFEEETEDAEDRPESLENQNVKKLKTDKK